ncbi:oxidoreductase [Marivirga lumbricoides]|uniref:Oxidoreductase n=1 Tax=Marivirga lumbricoides TaxID=1046115 RepID=A0ABQ1MER6_9BACT|nr:oxidoreductase [Marivirga lumbricoides]
MDIKNKVAVVTGASSGIGEATALMLAKAGAKVTIAARREEKLNALKEKIEKDGGSALVVPTDVTDKDAVEKMIRETKEKFGSVDILINNAGIMPLSFMKNLKTDEWEKMVDVNIKGVLNTIGGTLPIMQEQKSGHIINISSVAGRRVMPGSAVYSATKFAVRALSEGMRMELSPSSNIKVTSIEPGAVETELPNTITDDEVMENFKKLKEMNMLQSEDIAKSIVYAIEQADRVNVNEIMVMPTEQPQ